MSETVFAADPTRLLIAAAAGIVLLLLLIIKFKFHPVLSLLISALLIGLGAGMPVPTLVNTVEKGAGETLQGIVLLIVWVPCSEVYWKCRVAHSVLHRHWLTGLVKKKQGLPLELPDL